MTGKENGWKGGEVGGAMFACLALGVDGPYVCPFVSACTFRRGLGQSPSWNHSWCILTLKCDITV